MRIVAAVLIAVTTCVVLGGCGAYDAPVIPPLALVYTNTSAPIDTDMDGKPLGAKVGRATSKQVLSIVAWGDASIQAAAADGKIATINHADYHYENILGIYTEFTVIVTGD